MGAALRLPLILALTLWPHGSGAEEFRTLEGHGGPVMGVAVSGDDGAVLTTSFDNSVGVWTADGSGDPRWLDGHDAAVNTGIFLPDNRAASGGDDYAVLIWDLETQSLLHRLEGHGGKVMGLAATQDGARLASAGWDGVIRIWDPASGAALAELHDHEGPVNAVLWSKDGTRLYSASHDGTVLVWETEGYTTIERLAAHGFGVNVLALNEAGGWLAYGALDGGTRALDLSTGKELADLTAGRRPILALALSDDGSRIAVGDGEGYIMVVSTEDWQIERDFRAALNGPIWALDFTRNGEGILAGGIANEVFVWPLSGEGDAPQMAEVKREFHVNPDAVSNGERQFKRKCSVCHTLTGAGERRAGPPLAGLFGRRAGTVEGYPYSDALDGSDLVWTAETIDALFDIGPEHYIPGTKMPMQQIAKPEDRADLIDYLRRETKVE